jgi:hypothetical protein
LTAICLQSALEGVIVLHLGYSYAASTYSCRGFMMGFLAFLVLCVIAFFLWRISDQMPDVLFRLSEMQKDVAELRRQGEKPSD